MSRYYTLAGICRETGHAEIIFGDADRATVKNEMDEYKYRDRIEGRTTSYYKAYAIIPSLPNQRDIEAEVRNWELRYNQTENVSKTKPVEL